MFASILYSMAFTEYIDPRNFACYIHVVYTYKKQISRYYKELKKFLTISKHSKQ